MLKQILTCLKEHVTELYSVFPIPMLQNWGKRRACIDRTQSTLAGHSAILRGTNVKQMNANRTIRIAAQRTRVCED